MNLSAIPNILTVMRLLLVIPLVMLLLSNQYALALTVFVIAGLSDGLDGFIARQYGWTSRFGSIFDPIADKLLMVSSFFMLCWQELLPWWLFVTILLRDLAIVGGAYAYHQLFTINKLSPTYLSKFNTFMQILLVVVVIYSMATDSYTTLLIQTLIYMVLATTITSGVQYTGIWGKKAVMNVKQDNFREHTDDH
jgi:cardiolipin synthase